MNFSANGTNFAVIDVKGDGNCLWNSLVESKWVNFTPDILRENVFRQIDCRLNNGGPARRDIYQVYRALHNNGSTESIQSYMERQRLPSQASNSQLDKLASTYNNYECNIHDNNPAV